MTELYAVRMDVALPPGMDPAARDALLAREKAYSQPWQRSGHWPHIWRCAGQYANLSMRSAGVAWCAGFGVPTADARHARVAHRAARAALAVEPGDLLARRAR